MLLVNREADRVLGGGFWKRELSMQLAFSLGHLLSSRGNGEGG